MTKKTQAPLSFTFSPNLCVFSRFWGLPATDPKGGIQVWGWYDVENLAARWSKRLPFQMMTQKSYWSFTHHNVPTPKKIESSNLRVPESTQNIDLYVLIIYQIDNTVSLILWSLNIWENCWIKTFSNCFQHLPSLTIYHSVCLKK